MSRVLTLSAGGASFGFLRGRPSPRRMVGGLRERKPLSLPYGHRFAVIGHRVRRERSNVLLLSRAALFGPRHQLHDSCRESSDEGDHRCPDGRGELAQLLGAPTAGTGLERVPRVSPTPARRAFDQAAIVCHRESPIAYLRNSCARIWKLPELQGFARQGAGGFWAVAGKPTVDEIKPPHDQS
jgi:hypothetical protein